MGLFTGLFIYKSVKLVTEKVEKFVYRKDRRKEEQVNDHEPIKVELRIFEQD